MSKRTKAWARKARAELLRQLGGCCVDCRATERLEFDCIFPQGHEHHGRSTDQRMSFYRKEFRRGNLALRCARCNALKGDRTLEQWLEEAREFGWFKPVHAHHRHPQGFCPEDAGLPF